MQQYTVYLYLLIAVHVSGGIFTHHQEPITNICTVFGIDETDTAPCPGRGWMGTMSDTVDTVL